MVGDIVGSRFEFNNTNDYNFTLFTNECSFTDDTICTMAIGYALVNGISYEESLRSWCSLYPAPMGSYGGSFARSSHRLRMASRSSSVLTRIFFFLLM